MTPKPPAKETRSHDTEILRIRALQVQRGGARAAVLGANDGLVSTLCIVLAVAAAGADQHHVLLAGAAGLIAGAISMAAGEWISVRSQVELFQGILSDLKQIARHDTPLLAEQMQANFAEHGMQPTTARAAAQDVTASPHLFELYTSRVIGINHEELGSPWVAAGSSCLLFTIGALAPLIPWFISSGTTAVWMSIAFTGLASLVVGAYVGLTSGKNAWLIALRQLGIVVLAAVVTYFVGYLFGASFA